MAGLIVGIDIGKRQHEACLLTPQGEQLGETFSVSNSSAGVEKVLSRVRSQGEEDVVFGLEATGHYWLPLYTALVAQGCDVRVINPIQSDSLRNLYMRVTKTDRKDAFLIAQVIRIGQFTETQMAEDDIVQLRELSRLRVELAKSVGSLKNRLTGLLDRVFPEFADLFPDPFCKSALEVLTAYPSPHDLKGADVEELADSITRASRGHFGRDKATRLKEAAEASFGVTKGLDAFTLEIRLLLAQVVFISGQLEDIDARLEELMADRQLILSVPGVGPALGAAILGEIGDISRFPDAKHLRAYAGLDASVHQSGQFRGTRTRISKRGSPYLRRALWMAASVARLHDPHWRAVYQEKIQQGKAPTQAVTIVASRLCSVIFAVLTRDEAYDPQRVSPPSPLDIA